MNHELARDTVERPSFVVEIMGPAGAGKTTLVRALSQRHTNIQPDIEIRFSTITKLTFFIRNTLTLLPTYLRLYRHGRWFDRRETRAMVYLTAGLYVLGQQEPNDDAITILDHGPIYRLAFLREFGPELTESQRYKRWWASLLDQWIATIDIIVWLDAPNDILWERIRVRDRWHPMKEKCDLEAFEYLTRYRTAMEHVLAESVIDRQLTLLRFDTTEKPVEEIVETVLATFDVVQRV